MKIAIVSSSDLRLLPEVNMGVVGALSSATEIGVRTSSSGVIASAVEELAVRLATPMGVGYTYFRAGGGGFGVGRAATYKRDYKLVRWSDRVIAFFAPSEVMRGGTGHVVHAALMMGIPCEAWVPEGDGTLVTIGSDDGGFEIGGEDPAWPYDRTNPTDFLTSPLSKLSRKRP